MYESFKELMRKSVPDVGEKFWNKPVETMPREEIKELQWKLLQQQIRHAYNDTRLYKQKFKEAGITPEDIKSLDDFYAKVPTVLKDELRDIRKETGDPFGGALGIPYNKIAGVYSSTGTTGEPTVYALSNEDWEWLGEVGARIAWSDIGVRPGDLTLVLGARFHGGWEIWNAMAVYPKAANVIWTEVLPFPMNIDRALFLARSLKPKFMYLPSLAAWAYMEYINAKQEDPKEYFKSVKYLLWAGEVLTAPRKKMMMDYYGVEDVRSVICTNDNFLAGGECEECRGLHTSEDAFLIEGMDMHENERLGPGEIGDMVVTDLVCEAMPHLRWRTEDWTRIYTEKCNCRKTHARFELVGRLGETVYVGDKFTYPQQVENILYKYSEVEELSSTCQLVKTASDKQDKLIVRVAWKPEKTKDPEELGERIREDLEKELGMPVEVRMIDKKELADMQGKLPHKIIRLVKEY